jgi:hypothetical protein
MTGTGKASNDRYEVLSASAPHKRKQGPKQQSRSYPRGVGLDFRKLAGLTLASYIDHHGALASLVVYGVDWPKP